MDDEAEIIAEFLVESHENLDQLDRDLVELEQQPGSRELLSGIFRTIHTIKGTSGFLALGRLERLTHVGETLLSRLRDGEQQMTAEVTEVLLRMVDTVRALLDVVERTGTDEDPAVDVAPVVVRIEALLEPDPSDVTVSATAHAAPAEPVAPVTPAPQAAEAVGSAEGRTASALHAEAASDPERPDDATPPASTTGGWDGIDRRGGAGRSDDVERRGGAAGSDGAERRGGAGGWDGVDRRGGGGWDGVERRGVKAPDPSQQWDGVERRGVVDASVRVDVDLLDNLVQLVGELVLTRNQILQRSDSNQDVELVRASQRLDLVASELQESVMQTRMQPIGQVWSKMPRVVRDLSHQLGREVELAMEGHDTELDRSLLEAIKDPLTHLVRNAMDHGIERPEDRVAAGKPAKGILTLRAYHESGQVVVEIADDGKGIDPDTIAAVALERGVVTRDQLDRMDGRDVLGLIFRPGFSTAAAVSNISGRGVGMDVVRTNIERIGGTVDIQSEIGRGTTCRVRIPLTLAIIPALVVAEGGERYAIPQVNLVELVRIEGPELERDVEDLAGAPVLRLRGDLLPLVHLSAALGEETPAVDALTVVVLQSDDVRFGLCVSEVHDTQEIVVKPIGRQLKSLEMYAGATIMGDGRVALIIDVAGIAGLHGVEASTATDGTVHSESTQDTTALLVLEVGGDRRAALPLADVARLEEIPAARIERSGGVEVVQYRDGLLPLVRLAPLIGLTESRRDDEDVAVVVHENDDRAVGIVIDRVLDVVETEIVRSSVGSRAGVLGTAVVQDKVTDLVDIDAIVAGAGVPA